jgi:hypothetical protein
MRRRVGSAERVVLPVPESPKKIAASPFGPMLAEQCIGNTFFSGSSQLSTVKMDFFSSPAYRVPPMRMVRFAKFSTMKVPVAVP